MRSFTACTGLALLLVCSCNKSTEVLVVVSTDLVMPAEADVLQLDVTRVSDGTPIFSQSYPLTSPASLPASLDLRGSKSAPSFALRAQLLRHGVSLVERRVVMPFEPGRALELRIPLERICIGSACSGDTTCAGGQCVPVSVQTDGVPSIGPDPLAPVDLASVAPADLAPADLAPADLAPAHDQASSADLGTPSNDMSTCPAPVVPPVEAGCRNFDFSMGKLPDGLKLLAPGVTYDFICGTLNLHVTAGAHVYPDDVRIFIVGEYSFSTPFRLVAQYDVDAQGLSWVGVGARSSSLFVRGETRYPGPIASTGDVLHLETNANFGAVFVNTATDVGVFGHHHVVLTRTMTSGKPSTYDYTGDTTASLSVTPDQLPDSVLREFSVGNDNSAAGTMNPIEVHLHYLQFCSP